MVESSYDPLSSPFEMPVSIERVECRMENPLCLPERDGASFRTSLRGAFGEALVNLGCRKRAKVAESCLRRSGRRGCQLPGSCAVPWLHEPHVASQRRDHAAPLVLKLASADWTSDAQNNVRLSSFELALILLGRHAVAERQLVLDALMATGQSGLFEPTQRGRAQRAVAFDVRAAHAFSGTLGEWVHHRLSDAGVLDDPVQEIRLELATPLAASPSDFGSVVGNLAHDLVQWDLADSGLADAWGAGAKAECDSRAERARGELQRWLAGIRVEGELDGARLGRRRSRSTGGNFELQGYVGWLGLQGNLHRLLPWLVVLELRGGGKKKTFGLGEVHLVFPNAAPRPRWV